jgi:hypothetical protein
MTISATSVRFDEHTMSVDLTDGRTIRVPLAWFPRLLQATPAEREKVELSRVGLHWEAIDEDISIAGIIAGRRDVTLTGTLNANQTPRRNLKQATGTNEKRVYVERRPQGDYAVRRANSERASDVLPTQAKAIERARELSPGTTPSVERVRHSTGGSPDKWRKP